MEPHSNNNPLNAPQGEPMDNAGVNVQQNNPENPFYEPSPPNNPESNPFYEPPPDNSKFQAVSDMKSPDNAVSVMQNTSEPQIDPHLQFEAEKRQKFMKDPVASLFENEKKIAFSWLLFMTTYWTIIVLAQVIAYGRLLSMAVLFWCFGAIGVLGMFLAVRSGLYPSGRTHLDDNSQTGKGRYGAFAITSIISIDLSFLVALQMTNNSNGYELARGIFHFISLFWASLFFYRRFAQHNPTIARTIYPLAWIDILWTIIVIWVILYTNKGGSCWNQRVCSIYSVFVIFQIIFWVWPMQLITNWGLELHAPRVALHLLILAIFSDFPIFVTIITLPNKSYRMYGVIWCDVLIKSFVMIRSISHFLVKYAWLRDIKNKQDDAPYVQLKDEFNN